ncbi:FAD-dependent thymidylate synthase [Intestinibacter bartlettii]|jgi:thymidylate synthase (FAD)|uniref:FAD-dependent thymidylate synthase n=1 Tax=Intestinibacter bartlettii TaxID=261299 RepID=UPI0039F5016D
MKLIKQSFEFINQTDFSLVGIKKHIERCARVSYKSENKITDTSYEKFVNMLESRGHDRPLEFGTVYLTLRGDDTDALRNIFIYAENPWTKIRKQVIKAEYDPNIRVVLNYVTTNYRVIVENHLEEDLKYLCEPTEYHYKRYTAHMILDRGVMDEFRTHVGLSHLAESTRYCNYSKDKFGNELTFIQPCWDIRGSNYIDFLQHAEWGYFRMLKNGWTPQQARSVLPLGIKSELISCGFKDAWENFFKRRDAPDAHPMAQEIANPMHKEFFKLTKAEWLS